MGHQSFLFETVARKEMDTHQGEIRLRRIRNMEAEGNERMQQATEMDSYSEDGVDDTETRCTEFVYITNA
jgi:hypothetical protein